MGVCVSGRWCLAAKSQILTDLLSTTDTGTDTDYFSVRCPLFLALTSGLLSRAGEEGGVVLFELVKKPLGDCVQC
jgi:hypothetical protein